MSDKCDLFENGGEGDCGGPMFSDPQPEGVDLKVCAFHTLMNRNEWMRKAEAAMAERDEVWLLNAAHGEAHEKLHAQLDEYEARIEELTTALATPTQMAKMTDIIVDTGKRLQTARGGTETNASWVVKK